jgi:lipopolysaccharide transport system ATP-binding protein
MNNLVIKSENLYKRYMLGTIGYGTISHDMQSWWARFRGKEDPNMPLHLRGKNINEDFWALKDISFEIKQGDRVGIIGRNGAGKSTLLKILSKVTSPTSGEIKIRGRIASLLEVGTGFHPELTGRENIYLNGAIMGMKKREIDRKLDEIVSFAEVEKFIDTPVKRYSSGMYVRLAFAVAAHLEPDILIIDEVLAVGDAQFQKKCLGKMEDVSKNEGRTLLFVSHNLLSVSSLCNKGILLNDGKIVFDGDAKQAINKYIEFNRDITSISLIERDDRIGEGSLMFQKVWLENEEGEIINTIKSGESIQIVLEYITNTDKNHSNLSVACALKDNMGNQLGDLWNESCGDHWEKIPSKGKVRCILKKLPLNEGRYYFNVCARLNNIIQDFILDIGYFDVEAGDFFGTGRLPDKNQGIFLFDQIWDLEPIDQDK